MYINKLAQLIGSNRRTITQYITGQFYTVSHEKRSQHIFVRNFVRNQRILMQFSLLDLAMNNTRKCVNFTDLT